MLFSVAEDSWEFLGLQGDQTSQSRRKSILNIHWKDWCWSWSSDTLATWSKELTQWKDPDAGKDWRQEENGLTEDEMVGWYYRLNRYEFEQAPRDSEGLGSLACCSWTQLSNWTDWLEKTLMLGKTVGRRRGQEIMRLLDGHEFE